MNPVSFPGSNKSFGPPEGMDESQVRIIPAYVGKITKGSLDGEPIVVVAWKLSPEDRENLKNNDGVIYLTVLGGGLPPHLLSTSFAQAINL